MRRNEKEIRNIADIEAVIDRAAVLRLGLCDNGSPYIVPVCFGYEPKFLWIHSAHEGRKIDILKRNPRVCFEIDEVSGILTTGDPCDWGVRYSSVIGSGRAEFVEDPGEKVHGLTCIMNHYSDRKPYPFPVPALSRVCIIRIGITAMTGKRSSVT